MIERKRAKISIYDLGYALLVFGYMMRISYLKGAQYLYLAFELLGMTILVLSLLKNRVKIRLALLYIIAFGLVGISAWRIKDDTFIILIIAIATCTTRDFDRFVKNDLYYHIISIIAIILLCGVGIINNRIIVAGNVARYSLGFSHPNNLGAAIYVIATSVFYLHYKKFRVIHFLIFLLLFIFCWYVPHSRTSALMIGLICIIGLMLQLRKEKTWLLEKLLKISATLFLIIPGLSFYLPIHYMDGKKWIYALDAVLSKRIYLSYIAINRFHLNLFGNIIQTQRYIDVLKLAADQRNTIDNAYVYISLNFGLVALVLLLIATLVLYLIALKRKHFSLCICLLFVLIYGFSEQRAFNIGMNVFIVGLGWYLNVKKGTNLNNKSLGILLPKRRGTINGS